MPPLPVLQALDSDSDGEISASEIENAVAALKKLDKDGDGMICRSEFNKAIEEQVEKFKKATKNLLKKN